MFQEMVKQERKMYRINAILWLHLWNDNKTFATLESNDMVSEQGASQCNTSHWAIGPHWEDHSLHLHESNAILYIVQSVP